MIRLAEFIRFQGSIGLSVVAAMMLSSCSIFLATPGIRTGAYALNAADAADAACGAGNPAAAAARKAEQDMKANVQASVAGPGFGGLLDALYHSQSSSETAAIDAAYAAAEAAWAAAESCGYIQPRVPTRPGYNETFWDISS